MEITIKTDDVIKYGYAIPYYLNYIEQKGGKVTMAEMISDLGYCEPTIRTELNSMAKRGLIKKHYKHIKGSRGGKARLVAIEIL